jgi:hypothetical protein
VWLKIGFARQILVKDPIQKAKGKCSKKWGIILGPKQKERYDLHIVRSFLLLCKEESINENKYDPGKGSHFSGANCIKIVTHSAITHQGYAMDITVLTVLTN